MVSALGVIKIIRQTASKTISCSGNSLQRTCAAKHSFAVNMYFIIQQSLIFLQTQLFVKVVLLASVFRRFCSLEADTCH